eukprot:COSAG06_NODE_45481_length_354_cov_1.121569_1_plen_67_part_01
MLQFIILPRQALDKHRESTQKKKSYCFLTDLGLTSTYCEGSIVGVPDKDMLYFGNPNEHGRRANYSI